MTVPVGTTGYLPLAKTLHWITAAAVLFIIPAGLIMTRIDSGFLQNTLFDLHRSFGVLVLVLAVIRLGIRLIFGAPPPEATIERWQEVTSRIVHWALYALIVFVPIMGWVATSAFPAPITFFWIVPVPPLIGPDRELSETLFLIHISAAYALATLLVLHASAALYHHFWRGDGVLRRMLPSR